MSRLGPAVAEAFYVAAGELGMCSASWLFVREVAGEGGDELVQELRDLLGRTYPVLDGVAEAWLGGARAPEVDPAEIVEACGGARQVVVVGFEATYLDALLDALGPIRVTLLTDSPFDVDWDRMIANYTGRLEGIDMSSFQRFAGRRSALLTFLYGARGESTWVTPSWMRVIGADVRTQFRSIIGWNVLEHGLYVYPRWLAESSLADFSHVIGR